MLYIEDFDNILLVFNNLKILKIKKEDIESFTFNEVSRSVEYVKRTEEFRKGLIVNKFKLNFKGDEKSLKSNKCNKVIFRQGTIEIGILLVNKPLKFLINNDKIILKSDDYLISPLNNKHKSHDEN